MDAADQPPSVLQRSLAGDLQAGEDLSATLYGELRAIAGRLFARERGDLGLQPTAVVHEAWLRVADVVASNDRARFLAIAARAMRNVLVDHARYRRARKRGGESNRVALDALLATFENDQHDLLALDEALVRLAAHDPRCAQIVELRFFAGMTLAEVGTALGVSTTHTHRLWEFARAWLHRHLEAGDDAR